MTQDSSTALSVAKDLDRAMTYVADDIVWDAPTGRIEDAEAFRQVLAPFVQMVTGTDLLAAFGDDQTTVLPCLEFRTPAPRRMP